MKINYDEYQLSIDSTVREIANGFRSDAKQLGFVISKTNAVNMAIAITDAADEIAVSEMDTSWNSAAKLARSKRRKSERSKEIRRRNDAISHGITCKGESMATIPLGRFENFRPTSIVREYRLSKDADGEFRPHGHGNRKAESRFRYDERETDFRDGERWYTMEEIEMARQHVDSLNDELCSVYEQIKILEEKRDLILHERFSIEDMLYDMEISYAEQRGYDSPAEVDFSGKWVAE